MSDREQVWRERIEWQPWSGLTVAECCVEAGVSVAPLLSVEETADGTSSSWTTIDATIGCAGVRFPEANVSVCVDSVARFFDESRSFAEHRIKPWRQHAD